MHEKKAIRHLKKDPKLAKVIENIGEFNIKLTKNRYQSLIEAIITQQLSGSAATSIQKRFRDLYNSRFPKPKDVLETPNLRLRRTGLSKMKVEYIKELSQKIESKQLIMKRFPLYGDEQIIQELTKIRGIGRWTAEMFLIFSLGRLDVLPIGDLGLKKGIKILYSLENLPKDEQIKKIAEPWKPYRTVATWYLWKNLQKFDTIG